MVAFACQSGAGAEKAFVKLAKCIGIEKFVQKAIFIAPKDKATDEKNEQVLKFCKQIERQGDCVQGFGSLVGLLQVALYNEIIPNAWKKLPWTAVQFKGSFFCPVGKCWYQK